MTVIYLLLIFFIVFNTMPLARFHVKYGISTSNVVFMLFTILAGYHYGFSLTLLTLVGSTLLCGLLLASLLIDINIYFYMSLGFLVITYLLTFLQTASILDIPAALTMGFLFWGLFSYIVKKYLIADEN